MCVDAGEIADPSNARLKRKTSNKYSHLASTLSLFSAAQVTFVWYKSTVPDPEPSKACAIDLSGTHAVVTGGSSDIGRALCVGLAASGAEVSFTYFSDHEGAAATAAAVAEVGEAPTMLRANFAEPSGAAQVVEALVERGHQVDVLIHNAAAGVFRDVTELKDKHLRWIFEVNAASLLTLVRGLCASPSPLLADNGSVVALSSLGARHAIPQYAAIGASKAAMESLVRSLALELGPRGITANVVAPGIVLTRALDHFPNREQLLDVATRKTPLPRLTTPTDVVDLVLFLCSASAQMITGQTIDVDGGYSVVA